MSKIRRNELCHCASGKKYKKCCMKKDEEKQRQQAEALAVANAEYMETKRILDEMPAYLRMQAFASGDVDAEIRKYMADRAHWQKTIEFIDQLDEKTLVDALSRLKPGINASYSAFMRRAKKHTSAWELSEDWRKNLKLTMHPHDDALWRLSLCKLWRLRLPNRPSIEMIEDWMQDGYTLWMNDHLARACDRWRETWEAIRPLLRSAIRSTDDADKLLHGTQHIHDWLQDFLLELQNAAIEEPRFAVTGIELCNCLLVQFPGDSPASIEGWNQDLADFYFLADRPEEGERIFENLIRDNPDETSHYVHFAENLGSGPRGKAPIDIPRAIAVIEQAIARPVPDAEAYGLDDQLRHFKKLQAKLPPR
jgi:hypothetical protein